MMKSIYNKDFSKLLNVLLQQQENPDFIEPGVVGAEFTKGAGPSPPAFTVDVSNWDDHDHTV